MRIPLPTVKAEVSGDTARLTDPGDRRGNVLLFLLAPIMVFTFAGGLTYAWLEIDEWLLLAFAVPLYLIGLLVLFKGFLPEWKKVNTFHPAVLEVRPWPIRLGESVTLRYTRQPRVAVEARYVAAEAEVEEEASYTVGTETRTVSHTAWQQALDRVPQRGLRDMNEINAEWTLRIPDDGPASFSSSHNEIGWTVTAEVHYDRGKSDDSTFTLLVLPQQASAATDS